VGICGRPGSGKSSLTLSLFGMIEVSEGNIYIDSVNITCIPPTLLRSRLATLPQDCVLISGSVRYILLSTLPQDCVLISGSVRYILLATLPQDCVLISGSVRYIYLLLYNRIVL